MDVPQPVKTVTALAFIGYAALVYEQADDFHLELPITPVLHAEPAYTGGTAIATGEGGYYSRPPNAPIDPQIRAAIQLDS